MNKFKWKIKNASKSGSQQENVFGFNFLRVINIRILIIFNASSTARCSTNITHPRKKFPLQNLDTIVSSIFPWNIQFEFQEGSPLRVTRTEQTGLRKRCCQRGMTLPDLFNSSDSSLVGVRWTSKETGPFPRPPYLPTRMPAIRNRAPRIMG